MKGVDKVSEFKGMGYLKRKLATVRPRVLMRYRQYASKYHDSPSD